MNLTSMAAEIDLHVQDLEDDNLALRLALWKCASAIREIEARINQIERQLASKPWHPTLDGEQP